MNDKNIYLKLKMFLLENNLSETKAASLLCTNQSGFNKRLKSGKVYYSEVEKLLEALGYELVWQKKA